MKPIRLSIEGINSFTNEQVIDFEKVLMSGIFGIFGDTGSGKSTILDSIILALYGKMKRCKNQGDFINDKMKNASVYFVFSVTKDGENCVYEVKRTFKIRPNGDFAATADLYRLNGEDKYAVASDTKKVNSAIEEIIGLNLDDFRKCIVLPQGEFDEFLKSERRKRLDIIGRLFDLNKYGKDLMDKVKELKKQKEGVFNTANGELNAYASYDKNTLDEKNAQAENTKTSLYNLKKEFDEIEKIYNTSKAANENYKELLIKRELLQKSDGDKEEIERKRELCKNFNLLSDLFENSDAKVRLENEIKSLEDANEKNAKDKKTAEICLKDKKIELDKLDYNNKLQELADKLSLLNGLQTVIEDFNGTEKTLTETQADYKRIYGDVTKWQNEKDKLTAEQNQLKNKPSFSRLGEILSTLTSAAETAIRNVDINIALEYIKKENIPVGDKVLSLLKSNLKTAVDLPAAIKEAEKRIESEGNADREKMEELVRGINALEVKIGQGNEQLANVTQKGIELRGKYNDLNNRIESVIGGEKYKTVKAKIESERQTLIKNNENLQREIQRLQAENSTLDAELSKNIALISEKHKQVKEKEEKIEKNLSECGIIDITQAFKYKVDRDRVEKYEVEIKTYDESRIKLKGEIARLEGLTRGQEKLINGLGETEEKHNLLKGETERLNKDYISLQTAISNYAEMLSKKEQAENKLSEIKKDYDLVCALESLVKADGLLEFVADEYLKEICFNAQTRLLELSSGRYGLVYDGDFKVTDNFASGVKRDIDTLSGGETFLVSLSLALSLSAAIFEKSNRPIEFFFLDEGFGTLDSGLIDTVADSLEKLKGYHFLIGLISHVAELKQRINCKINVTHATEYSGSLIETVAD